MAIFLSRSARAGSRKCGLFGYAAWMSPLRKSSPTPKHHSKTWFWQRRPAAILYSVDVSPVPRPPLDGLIDDLYYLEGAPPYTPADAAAGAGGAAHRQPRGAVSHPRRHRHRDSQGPPTAAWSPYPPARGSSATHSGPRIRRRALQAVGLAPFLPMPAAELCDRPVTVEQVRAGSPLLSCETGWPRRTDRTRC